MPPPAEPIAVALREYSPNRLIFDVEAPRDGWLLVTDRWASGWQATVNGRDAPVWLGNFIFRAVRVRAAPTASPSSTDPSAIPGSCC